MDKTMMEELRISAWELSDTVPAERVVEDLYDFVQDNRGRFMIVDKGLLSI